MGAALTRGMGIVLILSLAGCGAIRDSRANPLNWFGRSSDAPTRAVVAANDPRPLVTVTELRIAPSAGGAIIEARGLPPVQGWWGADLVPVESGEAGTLAYEFRAVPAPAARRVGPPQGRELVVAAFASDARLAGVRTIRVDGAGGARVARR